MGFLKRIFGGSAKTKENVFSSEVDVEMKYCPQCGDEYRPDFKTCATCEVDLVDGKVKHAALKEVDKIIANRSMTLSKDDEMVTVQKGPMKDMKEHKVYLEKNFIPCLLLSDGVSRGGCCGGPQLFLQVRKEDVEGATHFLGERLKSATHILDHDLTSIREVFDAENGKNICPGCQYIFTSKEPSCPDCGLVLGVG